jgi:hypothetical protein
MYGDKYIIPEEKMTHTTKINVTDLIYDFLDKYEYLWRFELCDNSTAESIALAVGQYLDGLGIVFEDVEVLLTPAEIMVFVYGEQKGIDYSEITKEVICG